MSATTAARPAADLDPSTPTPADHAAHWQYTNGYGDDPARPITPDAADALVGDLLRAAYTVDTTLVGAMRVRECRHVHRVTGRRTTITVRDWPTSTPDARHEGPRA